MKSIDGLTAAQDLALTRLRALSAPARLRIVEELAGRTSCVRGDLATVVPLAGTTLWQHLKVLKDAGVVRGELDGEPNYCLEPDALRELGNYCLELADRAARCLPAEETCC